MTVWPQRGRAAPGMQPDRSPVLQATTGAVAAAAVAAAMAAVAAAEVAAAVAPVVATAVAANGKVGGSDGFSRWRGKEWREAKGRLRRVVERILTTRLLLFLLLSYCTDRCFGIIQWLFTGPVQPSSIFFAGYRSSPQPFCLQVRCLPPLLLAMMRLTTEEDR